MQVRIRCAAEVCAQAFRNSGQQYALATERHANHAVTLMLENERSLGPEWAVRRKPFLPA